MADTEGSSKYDSLAHSERLFRSIAENSTDAIARYDRDLRYIYINPAASRLLEKTPDDVHGRAYGQLGHPIGAEANWEVNLLKAFDSGRETQAEFRAEFRGETRYFHVRIVPERDTDGQISSVLVISRDVTTRRRAEDISQFLASASEKLSASLDIADTLDSIARLAIPFLADMCIIDLMNEDGLLERGASAHIDPEKDACLQNLRFVYPMNVNDDKGVAVVMRTGRSLITEHVSEAVLRTYTTNEDQYRILQGLAVNSTLLLPLVARGRARGVLSLAYCESNRRYLPEVLPLAEETAQRCALALDNALLFEKVKQMNRTKDEFIAMLGHELRNPLAAINNALEAVHHHHTEEVSPFLSTQREMLRQIRVIARLVDDLLDITRITKGYILLSPAVWDLARITEDAVKSLQKEAEHHSHDVRLYLPAGGLPARVDGIRVNQIVTNLLQNAIKYTPTGGRIDIRVVKSGPNAVIRITDNGIGIPPDLAPNIFDIFFRGKGASKRSEGGIGIGLTLVKRLVELHHGSIEVYSEGEGHGSVFVVTLPIGDLSTPASNGDDVISHKLEPSAARTVLVADDNALAGAMLVDILEGDGHRVFLARDGEEALALAKLHQPDVCLLDISLPGMDGYELARRLRALPEVRDKRLIALTGFGSPEDRQQALDAGYDEHLVKPANLATLKNALRVAE